MPPEWRKGIVTPAEMSPAAWSKLVFCLVYTAGASAMAWFVLTRQSIEETPVFAVLLLLPAAGLYFLWGVLQQIAAGLRYRNIVLRLSTLPGVVGGKLTGTIELDRSCKVPDRKVAVILRCEERTLLERKVVAQGRPSRWESTHYSLDVIWSGEAEIEVEPLAQPLWIPIDFTIPFACRETTMRSKTGSTEDVTTFTCWVVELDAEISGSKINATFEVPVLKTAGSDPGIVEAPQAVDEGGAISVSGDDLEKEGIVFEQGPAGAWTLETTVSTIVRQHRGRVVKGTVSLLVVTAALAAGLWWFVSRVFASGMEITFEGTLGFLIFLTALSIVPVGGWIVLWCVVFHRTRVACDGSMLIVDHSFKVYTYTMEIPLASIRDVIIEMPKGKGVRPSYGVSIVCKPEQGKEGERRPKTVLWALLRRDVAQWMVQRIWADVKAAKGEA